MSLYVCSYCSENLNSVDLLIIHINSIHRASTHSLFECKQGSCHQKFSNISVFKRHLNGQHRDLQNNISNIVPSIVIFVILLQLHIQRIITYSLMRIEQAILLMTILKTTKMEQILKQI